MSDPGMRDSTDVVSALQQAYHALRLAVDLQRRPDHDAGTQARIEEIHQLRTTLSAAALLMHSVRLDRHLDVVAWSDKGAPSPQITPAELLAQADTDLRAAMRHLDQAASSLTAARIKLTHLSWHSGGSP